MAAKVGVDSDKMTKIRGLIRFNSVYVPGRHKEDRMKFCNKAAGTQVSCSLFFQFQVEFAIYLEKGE